MQNQQYPEEGSILSSLCEAESILQTVATCDGESEAFSTLESKLTCEHIVQLNYRRSHDTRDDPQKDNSEHTPTPESETTLPIPPTHEINPDQQLERMDERVPTPPPDKQSKEKNYRVLTPPPDQQTKEKKNRIPTPPQDRQAEKKEDRVPMPPPAQPCEENTMLYTYSKYRDDPNVEAHVYAFLQTWEANHVSQRLMDAKAKRSKIMEFSMTLEGPAA